MVNAELILFPLLFITILVAVAIIGKTITRTQAVGGTRSKDVKAMQEQLASIEARLEGIQSILEEVP